MLRLQSLTIENFGPFKGSQVVEFPEEDGVVIVYGENMRGKTSLLNAIRFALFGNVFGRGTTRTALHKVGNWEEAARGNYGFSVELVFSTDGCHYKLSRVCKARVPEPSHDENYVIEFYLSENGTVLGPDQAQAELERIIPEQVSRFFLFDGELLQEYEDLLSSESDMGLQISEAIERILGVPILTSARATTLRLKDESEKSAAIAAQSDQKTREFGNQLADLQKQRDVLRVDLGEMDSALHELRSEKATLEQSLKRRERFATLMEKRDGLKRQLDELSGRLAEEESSLKEQMSSAWCSLLQEKVLDVSGSLGGRQREIESRLMRWSVLKGLKDSVSDACPTCLRPITEAERPDIERALAVENIGDIPGLEKELAGIRDLVSACQLVIENDHSEALKVRWEHLEQTRVNIASTSDETREIGKQLENVDEISLRHDKQEYEKTIRKIEAQEQAIRTCKESIAKMENDVERIQKRIDKLAGSDLHAERDRRILYSKLYDLFNDAVAEYRDQLRRRVEADATRLFLEITSEPDYARLSINENYGLTIVHEDGEVIPVRSAGAEHVVALSLVGALQNNAPLQGPIVIDSPFGRLDAEHTSNIVRALPMMAKQVILLVYEEELPADLARDELRGLLRAEWKLDRRSARHTQIIRRRN